MIRSAVLGLLAALILAAPASASVTWPLPAGTTTVLPGATLAVKVRQRQPLRVRLVQLAPGPGRVLAQRTLRKGTFTVHIPNEGGLTLALVTRGHLSTLVTPYVPGPCVAGRDAATLRVEPSSGPGGAHVDALLTNTGTTCLETGADYSWERQTADGGWEAVQPPPMFAVPAYALILHPGARPASIGAYVWPGMDPGAYRLVKRVGSLTLTAPFTVTPG